MSSFSQNNIHQKDHVYQGKKKSKLTEVSWHQPKIVVQWSNNSSNVPLVSPSLLVTMSRFDNVTPSNT